MQSFFFGAKPRSLFGHFLPAATPTKAAILLCCPFGQEAVRSQRLYRVLAERLVRAGHAVLRFDYYATGDSAGDDVEGELEGWVNDVLTADAELRKLSGCSDSVWMGMRLGGSLALLAAPRAAIAPRRVVAWDAVFDGRRYLADLRHSHVKSLVDTFSLMPRPDPRQVALDPGAYREEAIGYALSPALREQLAGLSGDSLHWPIPDCEGVLLGLPADDAAWVAEVGRAVPPGLRCLTLAHDTDWTADSAGASPLVPAQVLAALAQQLGAPL